MSEIKDILIKVKSGRMSIVKAEEMISNLINIDEIDIVRCPKCNSTDINFGGAGMPHICVCGHKFV